jgi:V/A-type H+-transporting ATPase subunit D
MSAKRSLSFSKKGFVILDQKRNILMRELMALVEEAKEVREKIGIVYKDAYLALQRANISIGVCEELAMCAPKEDGLRFFFRSVMGVEIPIFSLEENDAKEVPFGLYSSDSNLDRAYFKFCEVKYLTVIFARIENSVYRLTQAIRKTKKRANALKNAIIPEFERMVKSMSDVLEEKEREEFVRLKVIKRRK